MKTSLLTAAFAATLLISSHASAKDSTDSRAAQLLATRGLIEISNAGGYVERGTFQIQVSTKLGRPTRTLPDGGWLYEGFSTEDHQANGTLVVRFANGRVSQLLLVTAAVAQALSSPVKAESRILVADRR